jgi:arabinofuranosyltransferase
MIFSKSFISFTTSGLENSLSFLILALFFNEYFKNSDSSKNNVLMLSMYFALALFNRIDSILIYLPAFLYYFFFISQERFLKKLCFSFLGFLPFLIWYGFAFVYYGFIFPNTYYAKLNTGIPVIEYWVRGWHYYIANFLYDPITLLVILSSICLLIFQFQRRFFPILVSFAWISAYIIHIGGDFMMGRLFAVPFFISLIIFSQINWKVFSKNKIILGIVSIFIVQNIYSNVYEAGFVGSFSSEITSKIVVERAFYFNDTSLKNNLRKTGINNQIWAKDGKRFKAENINLVEFGCIGFAGYFAGSSVHIVDDLALSDAFLTQAPIMHHYTNINWKVGHLKRKIPRGYLESIASGENRIEDAEMAIRYDKIKLITQAPLFQKERWDAILDLNFGIR